MTTPEEHAGNRRALPWPIAILLALLGLPRVLLHDLDVIQEGSAPNQALVVVPVLVWLAVLAIAYPGGPLRNGVRLGAAYAVVLAVAHQALWSVSWSRSQDEPPRLGGNLSDLPEAAHEVIIRVAAVFSSLGTGLLVGFAVAVVAWALRRGTNRLRGGPTRAGG